MLLTHDIVYQYHWRDRGRKMAVAFGKAVLLAIRTGADENEVARLARWAATYAHEFYPETRATSVENCA